MPANFGRYIASGEHPGDTIFADHWNGELNNILNNFDPDGCDDASANLAAMQSTVDPGELSTESLATSLRGEIQRLRFAIQEAKYGSNSTPKWYESPSTTNTRPVIHLDNGGTDGGSIDFNASTTSFIKSSADGLTLSLGGFTSFSLGSASIPASSLSGLTTLINAQTDITANLGLSLSGGVLTITGADGTAISGSNLGYVKIADTTAGRNRILSVSAAYTIQDDSNASSHFTNFGFGITESANWGNAAPFWIYAVNRGNTALDGTDGNSAFFIARNPSMSVTPASANSIGNKSGPAATDDQNAILLMGTHTVANYTSLPCVLIGSINMTWLSSTTDWTIQALSNLSGIGLAPLQAALANSWTMPAGQNGASASTYLQPNGGTAPVFNTNDYFYAIDQAGWCSVSIFLDGDGGTDGSGAVNANIVLPYSGKSGQPQLLQGGQLTTPTNNYGALVLDLGSGNNYFNAYAQTGVGPGVLTIFQLSAFANGARTIYTNSRYRVF